MSKNKIYKEAGVNLEAGYEVIKSIKKWAPKTNNKGTMSSIGGFGALFDLKKYNFKDPILVSSTDGVGTKLLLSIEARAGYNSIGKDLVAMCVNDIIAQGAKPLFFLDYFSTGSLDPIIVSKIVRGISNYLSTIDTALIGGETAEMPGLYSKGHYDLAGFVVGAVERDKLIDGKKNVKKGDVIIALPSSGIHSNGFSLVRKIFFKDNNFLFIKKVPYETKLLIVELLTPTKLYVNQILDLVSKVNVHGIANITGGGFQENIPRVMGDHLKYEINYKDIKIPNIFKWMQSLSNASDEEMFSTFNMGVGMVVIVDPEDVDKTLKNLKDNGEDAYVIGNVVEK